MNKSIDYPQTFKHLLNLAQRIFGSHSPVIMMAMSAGFAEGLAVGLTGKLAPIKTFRNCKKLTQKQTANIIKQARKEQQ